MTCFFGKQLKFGIHIIQSEIYHRQTVSLCRTTINAKNFNEFGDSFLEAYDQIKDKPVIIVISSAKVSDWKGKNTLTNTNL